VDYRHVHTFFRVDADTFRSADGREGRWDALPDGLKLGRDGDTEIGRAIGCSNTTVANERRRRGVKLLRGHKRTAGKGRYTDDELRRQNFAAAMRRNFELELERRGYGDGGVDGASVRSSAGWMGDGPADTLDEHRNIDGSLRRRSPVGRHRVPAPPA